jgi:ferric-dicitrate binding protein FerR (iron transport regulator)
MMLAPATTVTLTRHDGAEAFAVTGEAYFVVAPQSTRAFVVQTTNARVRVLGTRFAVRQYPTERTSQVVVEDGKVALQTVQDQASGTTPTILSAHAVAVVTDSGIALTRGVATRDYISWIEGTLVFKDVSLRDVMAALSRAYDVTILVTDTALANENMTMEVSVPEQSVTRVLDLIGTTTNAHYTIKGRTYLLSPGRNATHLSPPTPGAVKQQSSPQPETQYGK